MLRYRVERTVDVDPQTSEPFEPSVWGVPGDRSADRPPLSVPPSWPPPTSLQNPLPPVVPPAAPRGGRGGRAAFGALVVAAGIGGGAIAGRLSAPSSDSASTSTPGVSTQAYSEPVDGLRADVSDLVASTLPGVVSITVSIDGGHGAGTGFILSADGAIVTNAHVVADARDIRVTFHDGSSAPATVVGVDRTDDLAVIDVDRTGLHALPLGNSASLRVGQPVVAIGNALALTGTPTATEGIVSAVDRSIDTDDGEHLAHVLQTDAAINPGNSGGPLLTLDGRVVGINSAGSSNAQNVGFAIAIDTAKPIIDQLAAGKTVTRPFLGVSTLGVDAQVKSQYGLHTDHGALITDVSSGSAAEAAGLQPGDVVVSANGSAISDDTALRDAIRETGAGNKLELGVDRKGESLTLTATLSTHDA